MMIQIHSSGIGSLTEETSDQDFKDGWMLSHTAIASLNIKGLQIQFLPHIPHKHQSQSSFISNRSTYLGQSDPLLSSGSQFDKSELSPLSETFQMLTNEDADESNSQAIFIPSLLSISELLSSVTHIVQ
jgi:hypothetical protein